jgi:hypothetical protein
MSQFQLLESRIDQHLKHFPRKELKKWDINDFGWDILQKIGIVSLKSTQIDSASLRHSPEE